MNKRHNTVLEMTRTALCSRMGMFVACICAGKVGAQLSVVSNTTPQSLFGGVPHAISVTLRNAGEKAVEFDARTRLYQTTSATAVRVADRPWKRIQVLPGQTIVESAELAFPAVNAATRFVVQWMEGSNKVAGTTEVLVYPPDLLKELKPLAGENPPGVYDPGNELKPLLQGLGVPFRDLEDAGPEDFQGRLAIFGPFPPGVRGRQELAERIEALAKRGAAVVWIQPPSEPGEQLLPSFYAVATGNGTVVVAQSDLVANLRENPRSQLNLVQLARHAMQPRPSSLPHPTHQP